MTPLHPRQARAADRTSGDRGENGGDAMTRMLASVADAAEAGVVVQLGADIIDLKDARRGALGAVSLDSARQAIAAVAGRSETSAALGDPPYDEDEVVERARALAAMGVDYVKLAVDAPTLDRLGDSLSQTRARRRPRRHDVRGRKARFRSPRQTPGAGLQGRDARHARQDTWPADRASRGRAAQRILHAVPRARVDERPGGLA